MTHSDLKGMCHKYGLEVFLYPHQDMASFVYVIRHSSRQIIFDTETDSLASITTTELYEMSAEDLENLVVDCSIRSMAGLC
jgi:hypothetical protein